MYIPKYQKYTINKYSVFSKKKQISNCTICTTFYYFNFLNSFIQKKYNKTKYRRRFTQYINQTKYIIV